MIASCLQSPVLGLHSTSGETETPNEGSSQALPWFPGTKGDSVMPDITSRGRFSECLTHVLSHLTILSTPILQKSKLRHGASQLQRQSTAPPLLFQRVAVGWFVPPAPPPPALSPPSSPALSFPSPTTHSARLGPCEVSAVTAFPSLITSQPRCWVDQRQL